jgi:hypothetical protein
MMPLFGFLLANIFNNLGGATAPPTSETTAAPITDPESIDSKLFFSPLQQQSISVYCFRNKV